MTATRIDDRHSQDAGAEHDDVLHPRSAVSDRLVDRIRRADRAVREWREEHPGAVEVASVVVRAAVLCVAGALVTMAAIVLLTSLGVSATSALVGSLLATMCTLLVVVSSGGWERSFTHVVATLTAWVAIVPASVLADLMSAEASTWVDASETIDPQVSAIVSPVVGIGVVALIWIGWLRFATRPRAEAAIIGEPAALSIATMARDHDESRLLRVARHEAAHALTAHRLGLDVEQITTRPRGGVGGYVRYRDNCGGADPDIVWAACVSAFAGHVVDLGHEQHDTGSNTDLTAALGHAINLASIGRSPRDYGGQLTIAAILDAAVSRARTILEGERDTLDRMVGRLLREREVDFGDAAAFAAWSSEEQ